MIRKLRWIGLAEEARRLELAVSIVPSEQRGSALVRAAENGLRTLPVAEAGVDHLPRPELFLRCGLMVFDLDQGAGLALLFNATRCLTISNLTASGERPHG